MTLKEIEESFELEGEGALEWFEQQIATLRTGRVRPDLLDSIVVEHYGVRTPLKGLCSIANSDARTLVVTPWDPGAVPAISKAIVAAQLGVQPIDDGKVIRLPFPSLTDELRAQTIKHLNRVAEEARIRLRRGRDEGMNMLKEGKQDKSLTEDDFYEGKEKLDAMIDKFNDRIAQLIEKKEKEIKTV